MNANTTDRKNQVSVNFSPRLRQGMNCIVDAGYHVSCGDLVRAAIRTRLPHLRLLKERWERILSSDPVAKILDFQSRLKEKKNGNTE